MVLAPVLCLVVTCSGDNDSVPVFGSDFCRLAGFDC